MTVHRSHALSTYKTLWILSLFCAAIAICAAPGSAHDPDMSVNAELKAGSDSATEAYVAAAESQTNGNYAEAAELWQKYAVDFPDDPLVPRVQHYLGVCRLRADDISGAEEAFEASLNHKVDKEKADFREDTYINLGWVWFLRGADGEASGMERAGQLFGKYIAEYPKGQWLDQALFYRGESLINRGKVAEGVAMHKRVVDDFPDSKLRVESLYAVGAGSVELGELETATKQFDEFISNHSDDPLMGDVAFRRGQLFVAEKEFAKAARLFQLAGLHSEYSARDQAWFQCGYCLSASRNYESAAKAYLKVANDFPSSNLSEQANLDAGRCLVHALKFDAAEAQLSRVLKSGNADRALQAHHWLSRVDLASKKFDKAQKHAEDGLSWIQKNATAKHRMRLPLRLDHAEALEGIPAKRRPAMEEFVQLVDEYPKSNVAPRALHRAVRLAIALGDEPQATELAKRFDANYEQHPLAKEVKQLSADMALAAGKAGLAEEQLNALVGDAEPGEANPSATTTSVPQENEEAETAENPEEATAATTEETQDKTQDQTGSLPAPPMMEPLNLEARGAEGTQAGMPVTPPNPAHALKIKLAQSQLLQEKYEACIQTLEPLAETAVGSQKAKALSMIGASHHGRERYAQAIESCLAALAVDPNAELAAEVGLQLAKSLEKAGELEKMDQALRRVVDGFPKSKIHDQALLHLAESELAANKIDDGMRTYRRLLTEHPKSQWADRAIVGVARIAMEKKEYRRALSLVERLADVSVDEETNTQSRLLRSSALQKLGDHAGALKELESLLEAGIRGNARADALLMAAPSHAATEHPGMARLCLKSILKENERYPRRDQVIYQLAWLERRQQEEAAALQHFGELAGTMPNSRYAAEANYHLGESAFDQNKPKEALTFFAAAAKAATSPDLAERSLHRLAWCYFKTRRYADAESVLDMQLRKFPNSRTGQVARFLKAECMYQQSDFEAAIEQFRLVASGDGLSAEQEAVALLHGGQCAGKLEAWPDAERWLSQIHLKFPNTQYAPIAYWEMAQVMLKQEREAEAMNAMRRSARSSKSLMSAQAQFALASRISKQGKIGEAYREFQVLMYGYGGTLAEPDIKELQTTAALKAADCAATKAKNGYRGDEEKFVRQAEKCLNFVIDEHPDSDESETAIRRLANLMKEYDVVPLKR